MENLIYYDGVKSNNPLRELNINLLKNCGFVESGQKSTSGIFRLVRLKTKYKLVFGTKSNVGGKGNTVKYFSLSKDYQSESESIKDFKYLVECLDKNKSII
jgi:hypothetical protein